MTHWPTRHCENLLVFTDLDGTLLDHQSYSYAAALPAIEKLEQFAAPLIPVTSKTCAELLSLRQALRNEHPFVVENGAAIYYPENYFPDLTARPECEGKFSVYSLGKSRQFWCDALANVDSQLSKCFRSFSEMGDAGIAKATGLSLEQAEKANQRQASEPVQWLGDEQQLAALVHYIEALEGQVIKGGRFLHILSNNVDKGRALSWLVEKYRQCYADSQFRSMALGDADNDLPMFASADHAVVIRSEYHQPPDVSHINSAEISEQTGPAGWNTCVLAEIEKTY